MSAGTAGEHNGWQLEPIIADNATAMTMLRALVIGSWVFAWCAIASAQDGRTWVVVGAASAADAGRLQAWVTSAESELRAAGRDVLEASVVAGRLRERMSSRFELAPRPLVHEISQAVEQALEHVAMGRNADARAVAEPLLERAESHRAALGRDPQTAPDLGNLCLHVVRSHLQERASERARAAARRCLRLLPDLDPSPRLQDPRVRRLIDDIRRDVEQAVNAATLVVQIPAGSNRACDVRLNGRPVGQTPTVRAFVPEGEYDVQLECEAGGPGRVHRVTATLSGPTRIVIDPELDAAMTSDGALLSYDRSLPSDEMLLAHASRIGEAAGVGDVMLVTLQGSSVQFQRIPRPPRARIAANAGREQVSAAVVAVLSGRSYASSPDMSDGLAGAGVEESSRPILGPLLLGVAGLAGGGIVIGSLLRTGCVERDPSGFCTVEDRLNELPLALYGAAGGVAIAAALLWFLLGADSSEPPTRSAVAPGFLDVRF